MTVMESSVQEFLRTYKVRRVGRIAEYACLMVSGILLSFFPSMVVSQQVGHPIQLLWSVSMGACGAMCLWGAITDRWLGEYTGLPLLSASLLFFSSSAFASAKGSGWSLSHDSGSGGWILLAFGLIIAGFGFDLIARWRDVQAVKGYASRHPDENYRGGPKRRP